MGYIIALVLLVIVVPLLFMALGRKSTATGGVARKGSRDRGVTVSRPSSDQPTPRADATNQAAPEAERRLPPG